MLLLSADKIRFCFVTHLQSSPFDNVLDFALTVTASFTWWITFSFLQEMGAKCFQQLIIFLFVTSVDLVEVASLFRDLQCWCLILRLLFFIHFHLFTDYAVSERIQGSWCNWLLTNSQIRLSCLKSLWLRNFLRETKLAPHFHGLDFCDLVH